MFSFRIQKCDNYSCNRLYFKSLSRREHVLCFYDNLGFYFEIQHQNVHMLEMFCCFFFKFDVIIHKTALIFTSGLFSEGKLQSVIIIIYY